MPARSMSRWDAISASFGSSRRMGMKYWEIRMENPERGKSAALLKGIRPELKPIAGSSAEGQEDASWHCAAPAEGNAHAMAFAAEKFRHRSVTFQVTEM